MKNRKEDSFMKKTRLFFVLFGIFLLCFGFSLFMTATIKMENSEWYYTWKPPYSEYEASVIITKIWGIVLLIIGGLAELLCLLSKLYESKNIQDVNPITSNTIKCHVCGIKTDSTLTICPKCKTKLRN